MLWRQSASPPHLLLEASVLGNPTNVLTHMGNLTWGTWGTHLPSDSLASKSKWVEKQVGWGT